MSVDGIATRLKTITIDWLQGVMLLLTIAGLGVSLYLMWGYTAPGATLACGGSHGCDTVKDSVYANLMGIPMPTLGLITYLILSASIQVQNHNISLKNGALPYIALIIFAVSLAGVLYSAYLTYVELYIIYAICRWCVASAIIMTAIFVLSLFNLRKANKFYVEG
jgi:uncharacterized membrane protein